MIKRAILLLLAFSLLAIAINMAGREELMEGLFKADLILVFSSICVYSLCMVVRGAKWWFLFVQTGTRIPLRRFIPRYMILTAAGTFTPLRVGELLGIGILPEKHRHNVGQSLFIIILDRFIELFFLIVHIGAALLLLGFRLDGVPQTKTFFCGLGVLAIFAALALFILLGSSKLSKTAEGVLLRLPFFPRINAFMVKSLHDFHRTRQSLEHPYFTITVLIIGTLAAAASLIFSAFLLLSAILDITLTQAFIADGIGRLLGVISLLPSGIGSSTISTSYTLSVMGFKLETAMATTSICTIILILINSFWGIVGLSISWLRNLSSSKQKLADKKGGKSERSKYVIS